MFSAKRNYLLDATGAGIGIVWRSAGGPRLIERLDAFFRSNKADPVRGAGPKTEPAASATATVTEFPTPKRPIPLVQEHEGFRKAS